MILALHCNIILLQCRITLRIIVCTMAYEVDPPMDYAQTGANSEMP